MSYPEFEVPGVSLARFRSLLAAIGPLSSRSAPLVLDLGCGDWYYRPTLRATFPDARIVGIDFRVEPDPDLGPDRGALQIQADMRRLPLPMRGVWGLIVVRHPDVDRSHYAWEAALREVPALLCPGGVILITTYSAAELHQARGWVRGHPGLVPFDPPPAQLAPPSLIGHDRFYTAFRRLAP